MMFIIDIADDLKYTQNILSNNFVHCLSVIVQFRL